MGLQGLRLFGHENRTLELSSLVQIEAALQCHFQNYRLPDFGRSQE